MIRMQTNKGIIDLELNAKAAPVTCENFIDYVERGHYNNTVMHRVIPSFIVQGGGFNPGMQEQSAGASITNEADNGLRNDTGTIAMARTGDPHSASAQFFINVNDNEFLNHTKKEQSGWGYCVFGKVVSGMDVVMEISGTPTASHGPYQDVPTEQIIMENVTHLPDGATAD